MINSIFNVNNGKIKFFLNRIFNLYMTNYFYPSHRLSVTRKNHKELLIILYIYFQTVLSHKYATSLKEGVDRAGIKEVIPGRCPSPSGRRALSETKPNNRMGEINGHSNRNTDNHTRNHLHYRRKKVREINSGT